MKENGFFIESFGGIRSKPLEIITMPIYDQTYLTINEANTLPWQQFKNKIRSLATITSQDRQSEFILVPKNVNWTTHDLAIFAGEKNDDGNNPICEFSNFSRQAGIDFFALHFGIAEDLIACGHRRVQFTFGYNPLDYTPGHHSLKRFHTHLRSLGYVIDNGFVQALDWKQANWFERLTVVEPFSLICYDIFNGCLKKGMFSTLVPHDLQIKKGGYVSLVLNKTPDIDYFTSEFRSLYDYLSTLYAEIESIFTDRTIDAETERYLPLIRETRLKKLNSFLELKDGLLSDESVSLLTYLAKNLRRAARRNVPAQIESSSQVYITKGFAGGFSFTIEADSREIIMDFFPRVITTTGPTKNIFGDGRCVGFKKINKLASDEAKQEFLEFRNQVKTMFEHKLVPTPK